MERSESPCLIFMSADIDDIRKDQKEFLNLLKNNDKPYYLEINGINILLRPNVFPPTTDTKLILEHLNCKKGDRILDLSSGSGIISIIAGTQGAIGLAADINPDAVFNSNENFHAFGLNIVCIESSMFQKIPVQKFDYIFFNGPYIEGEITEYLEYSFFGARYCINELFSKAGSYLSENGKMLVAFAEYGEIDYLEKTGIERGYSFRILGKRTNTNGKITYRLYEFSKSNNL